RISFDMGKSNINMPQFFKLKFSLLFILYIAVSDAIAQPVTLHQSVETSANKIRFLTYLPKDYNISDEKGFPLLMFLHGLGEKGENIEIVKRHGPPNLIKK